MHALFHIIGLDNAGGPWYLFWSGFASDIPELAALGMIYRKLNCHEPKCWRIGIHHQPPYIYCGKHLKGVQK